MPADLKITGLADLKEMLGEIETAVTPLAEGVLTDIMDHVVDFVGEYPPQPPRDRAKTFNRYVRGVGIYPRSAFNEAGELISLVAGIDKVIFSSEQLSMRWRKQIHSTPRGTEATIRNLASYSDFVVGDMQTDFHAETGWRTIDGAIEELEPFIDESFEFLLDSIEMIVLG
jgi:hypothetical protein